MIIPFIFMSGITPCQGRQHHVTLVQNTITDWADMYEWILFMYVCIDVFVYVCMYLLIYVYMYMCTYICSLCVCVCIYIIIINNYLFVHFIHLFMWGFLNKIFYLFILMFLFIYIFKIILIYLFLFIYYIFYRSYICSFPHLTGQHVPRYYFI